MKKLISLGLVLALSGCCSVNKQAISDVAGAASKFSAELQTYWDADVAAGKHDAAWATAKKADMSAYLKAVADLSNAAK